MNEPDIATWVRRIMVLAWACCMVYVWRDMLLAIIILLFALSIPYGLLTNLVSPSRTRRECTNSDTE